MSRGDTLLGTPRTDPGKQNYRTVLFKDTRFRTSIIKKCSCLTWSGSTILVFETPLSIRDDTIFNFN